MEADSPAGPGAPEPLAEGAAGEFASVLRRIKGKLFT
ncbi:SLC35F2 isoform 4 [Pongo abelii]|nr:SLC35F2 isoform 4 [Pongo abelii]